MNEYKTYRVISFYATVLVIFKMIIYSHGIDKGFDIIDDGFNMLHYTFSEYYNITIHSYFKILNAILPSEFFNIINLRVLAFLIYLFCAIQLIIALIITINETFLLKSNFKNIYYFIVIPVVFSGIFLTIQDRLFNYNVFNLFISSTVFMLLVIIVRKSTISNKISLLIFMIIGFLIGLQFHIKFSTAVIIMLLAILITFKFRPERQLAYLITLLVSSGVSAVIIIFNISESPSIWLLEFISNYNIAKLEGYGTTTHILGSYIFPAIWYSLFILISLFTFYISFLKSRSFFINPSIRFAFSQVASFVVLSVLIFALSHVVRVDHIGRTGNSFIYYSVIIYPLIVLEWYSLIKLEKIDRPFPKNWSIILFLSLVFPFIVEFGGMSNLSVANFTDTVFWFFALALLFALILINDSKYLKAVIFNVFLIATISSVHFVHNYLIFPIRSLSPLWEQNIELNGVDNIKVDFATAKYINDLKSKISVSGFSEGDKILFLYNEAGSVYLRSGFSPVIPLFLKLYSGDEMDKILIKYNESILQKYASEYKDSWIMLDKESLISPVSSVIQSLVERSLLFDSIISPYAYGGSTEKTMYLYKPVQVQ